jgi:hypothetical protein
MPDPLTFSRVPSLAGGVFAGKVDASAIAPFNDLSEVGVLPFLWTLSNDPRGWPVGWQPATARPIPLQKNGTWFVHIGPGTQYAALLMPISHPGFADPKSLLGALPTTDAVDGLVASELGVRILSTPDLPLTGLVTAYQTGCRKALPSTLPHLQNNRPLNIHVWVEQDGETTDLAGIVCQPSGFWSFGVLDWPWNRADRYAVAAATDRFKRAPAVPGVGPEVVAVSWASRMDGMISTNDTLVAFQLGAL